MNRFKSFLLVLLGLSFVSAYFYWKTMQGQSEQLSLQQQIAFLVQDFEAKEQSIGAFSLKNASLIYGNNVELFSTSLPNAHKYRYKDIASLYRYEKSCDRKHPKKIKDQTLQKALLWAMFRCGHISQLPFGFFRKAPYLHPLGNSFVSLALRENPNFFSRPNLLQLVRFLHIREWSQLPLSIKRNFPSLTKLSQLSPEVFAALIAKDQVVLSEQYILIQQRKKLSGKQNEYQDDGGDYLVYTRSSWDEHTELSPFMLATVSSNRLCLTQGEFFCWARNEKYTENKTKNLSMVLRATTIVLVLSLIALFIWYIYRRQKLEAQKRFIFETLTHELRTPSAAIQLALEPLRKDFDQLPEASKSAFLNLCNSTQRLNRVINASKQYLQSHQQKKNFHFQEQTIESMADYFSEILQPYQEQIEYSLLSADQSIQLDPYWYEVCLKGLVENAIHHGVVPVRVEIRVENKKLISSVADQGKLEIKSFDQLAQPFTKGEKSKGMGLGLSIIKKIIRDMGAKIILEPSPTKFILVKTLKSTTHD